jgi:hypothetical protein
MPMLVAIFLHLQEKAESIVLNYAKESKGAVEVCVATPGLINAPAG